MKKLTSFMCLNTGEGERLAFPYSEVAPDGTIISQNNKGNFLVLDEDLEDHTTAIKDYINQNHLKEE